MVTKAKIVKSSVTALGSVNRDLLLADLAFLKEALEKKPTIPIYAFLHLKLDKNGITIITTDGEITAQAYVDGNIANTSAQIVPAIPFFKLIGSFSDDIIRLKKSPSHFILSTSAGNFKLVHGNAEAFPSMDVAEAEDIGTFNAKAFCQAIEHVSIAGGNAEDLRIQINGIHFIMTPERLRLACTDANRIGIYQSNERQLVQGEHDFILGHRTTAPLIAMLQDAKDDTVVSVSRIAQMIRFTCGKRELTSRVLSGNFPDLSTIQGKAFQGSIKVPILPLYSATKRVEMLTDSTDIKSVELKSTDEGLLVISGSGTRGESQEAVPIEAGCDLPLHIAMQIRYLSAPLQGNKGNVLILYNNATEVMAMEVEQWGKSCRYYAMPVALKPDGAAESDPERNGDA